MFRTPEPLHFQRALVFPAGALEDFGAGTGCISRRDLEGLTLAFASVIGSHAFGHSFADDK